ncbi:MAG: hypothetical protein OXE46_09730 [Chloroflexi bacterium]|nr:hypothetical protein [Chloroflexota bacterium]
MFSPDELRYALRPVNVADALYSGDLAGVLDGLLRYHEHHGFITAALAPAYIHRLVYGLIPNNELSWAAYWQQPTGDFRFSALLLSLPSVFCIGMLYILSRRAGGSPAEALLAAFFFAAANTFFLFSRHFMPIDIPVLIALAGIYCALHWRDNGFLSAVGVGILAFLVVWVYHGYVTLAALVALVYGVFLARNTTQVMLRGIGMALGGALIFLPLLLYNHFVLGIDMLQEMRWFSETVTLGSYAEGWLFPFMYLGDVESGLALVWLCGLILGCRRLWRERGSAGWSRGLLWLGCLAALYLLMAFLSTGLQRFVLYGRIARALVPFIALFSAWGLLPILARWRPLHVAGFCALVALLAAANFIPALQLQHPREIARQVYAEYDDVSFETTFHEGANTHGFHLPVVPEARYQLFNASFYYPITEMESRPNGETLVEISHPFNHRLWQYEGMTPEMRDMVRRDPVMIWLIDSHAEAQ